MKFTLENASRANLIRGYSPQEIRIGDQHLTSSCIVTADTLIADWEPRTFAELQAAHLEKILALQPELVLLGTGPTQRFPPTGIRAARRTFNILVQEERRVAAGLFLS
jgi:uncharacterized protein